MTLNADLNTDINTTDETLNRKRFEIVVKHILKDYIKDANVNDIIIDFEEPILSEKNIHSSFTFENLYYLIKERVYIPFYNASI